MKRFVSRLMGLRPRFIVMGLGFTYAVSSPIRQSFALDASRSDFGAFKVIHAKDRTRRRLRAGFAAALHRGQDRVPVASALAFGVIGLLAESFAKAMHHELDQVAAGFCLKINGPCGRIAGRRAQGQSRRDRRAGQPRIVYNSRPRYG
jgi:hypothetical protein